MIYSIGFGEETIKVEGKEILYGIRRDNGDILELRCNIDLKRMDFCNRVDQNEFVIITNVIIDLNDIGERWEGDSLLDLPFGYGRIYSANNTLKYYGCMFEGKKVCYGEEYYEDGTTLEYKGNFLNNKRHGKGILYNKGSIPLFEGNWQFGDFSSQLIIPAGCSNVRLFTDNVKELIIEDSCYKDVRSIHFESNCILERLVIGRKCFTTVSELVIAYCSKLKSVVIDNESFVNENNGKRGRFLLYNCDKLEMIEIKEMSFKYYYEKFELHSIQ